MTTPSSAQAGQTTALLLIRHAHTVGSRRHVLAGRTNLPLSPTGRRQAGELAQHLADCPIAAVYASPLARAQDTAAPLAQAHQLAVLPCPELREINLGLVDGWEAFAAYEQWPALIDQALDPRTDDFAFPGGERWSAVQARAERAMAAIVGRHPGDVVAVVTHGAVLGLLLATWQGQPRGTWRQHQPPPGSLAVAEAHLSGASQRGPLQVRVARPAATAFWSQRLAVAVALGRSAPSARPQRWVRRRKPPA